MERIYLIVLISSFLTVGSANGQTQPYASYKPSEQEIKNSYAWDHTADSLSQNTILNSNIKVHWQMEQPDYCWYIRQVTPSEQDYILVNVRNGKKEELLSPDLLAKKLSEFFHNEINGNNLKIDFLKIVDWKNKDKLEFSYAARNFIFYRKEKRLESISDSTNELTSSYWNQNRKSSEFMPLWSRWNDYSTTDDSFDHLYSAKIREGNIFIRNNQTGEEKKYTNDGNDKEFYGCLAWSPDSKSLIGYRIIPVTDSNVYYILSSVAGTTRGVLQSHPYKQPGDPFTTYEMYEINPKDPSSTRKIKTDKINFFGAPELHWEKNNRYFTYERVERGHQRFRIIRVDLQTGDTTNILDEKTTTFIYENRLWTFYLKKSPAIIYASEKDGWQHLYLLNTQTGKEDLITKGKWIVRNIDSIDESKKEIWFSASGMNPKEDPYYIHYYRIGLNGENLIEMTPEIGTHHITYSPDKKYYIDSYSEINIPPITLLKRTADAKKITLIEQADIKAFQKTGLSMPEKFKAKGRDGQTDIYGIVCKPSKMKPGVKYPVIENIYAGPQDSFVPKAFLPYCEMQSIAELGFIVVQIDGMGTANRSKAFHDVCWKNLQDAGFPDRILWIKALAEKYPYVDTSRVGLYGTSAGGQDALCGLLTHPEFYKAGVAACGCHDNRIDKQWWNEQWMGYPVGPHYEQQSNVTNAFKLKGKLMLIVGEADTNVPPESTYRVADALIRAGKAFDFLPIPGANHTDGGPYGRARKKDFFVRNLLGTEPPDHNATEDFPLSH